MKLVTSKDDIRKNAEILWRYIGKNDVDARKLVVAGLHYVVFRIDDRYLYVPSRFGGYKNNNPTKHLQTSDDKDGRHTNLAIEQIFGKASKKSEDFETDFLALCESFDLTPHVKDRSYWWDLPFNRQQADHSNVRLDDLAPGSEVPAIVLRRLGHCDLKKRVLKHGNCRCAVTGVCLPKLLHLAHIKSWRSSTGEEKVDINNCLLLTPTIHALFDLFLISISTKKRLMISSRLPVEERERLNIVEGAELIIPDAHEQYLKIHRKYFVG